MRLGTYWKVWYLATDGIWHHVTYELGNISGCYFDSLPAAEAAARRLTEGKDVVTVEVREERSVLSLPGPVDEKTKILDTIFSAMSDKTGKVT